MRLLGPGRENVPVGRWGPCLQGPTDAGSDLPLGPGTLWTGRKRPSRRRWSPGLTSHTPGACGCCRGPQRGICLSLSALAQGEKASALGHVSVHVCAVYVCVHVCKCGCLHQTMQSGGPRVPGASWMSQPQHLSRPFLPWAVDPSDKPQEWSVLLPPGRLSPRLQLRFRTKVV